MAKDTRKVYSFITKICSEPQFCTDFRNVSFVKFGWVSEEKFTQKFSSVLWVKFDSLNAVWSCGWFSNAGVTKGHQVQRFVLSFKETSRFDQITIKKFNMDMGHKDIGFAHSLIYMCATPLQARVLHQSSTIFQKVYFSQSGSQRRPVDGSFQLV